MPTAASYHGEVQTKTCPHCGDERELPSEEFRALQSDTPTEAGCCGAIVDWDDEPTVEYTPEEAA